MSEIWLMKYSIFLSKHFLAETKRNIYPLLIKCSELIKGKHQQSNFTSKLLCYSHDKIWTFKSYFIPVSSILPKCYTTHNCKAVVFAL